MRTLPEEELKEYSELFEKYFLKSFTSRLSDYSDPKIEVRSTEVLNAKYTTKFIVQVIPIVYKFI